MEGRVRANCIQSVERTYHVSIAVVAGEIVRAAQVVGVWEVPELNERFSDISNNIHDRGRLRSEDGPKVMGECASRPIHVDRTELWIHRVV